MRRKSSMTYETLVETCRHNFLTSILVQMGVVECKTWKQLQEHGQTAQLPSSEPRRRTIERPEGVDHLQGAIKTRPSKRKPWRPICSKLQPLVQLGVVS